MSYEAVDREEGSEPIGNFGNRRAKPGYAWLCNACGKRSRDWYGNESASRGWDESCVLNAVLVKDADGKEKPQ